jgi:hypothetical protein
MRWPINVTVTAAAVAFAAGCALLARPADDGVWFKADFSASGYPLYGFTARAGEKHLGTRWELLARPGAGPGGGDAAEIGMVPQASDVTEGYYGWSKFGLPPRAQGQPIYIRLAIKLLPPLKLDGADGSGWGDKLIILGDDGRQGTRLIWNLRFDPADRRDRAIFRIERRIEGPEGGGFDTDPLPVGEWIFAQLEVKTSSSYPGSNDGRLSLYLDGANRTPQKPTNRGRGVDLSTETWDDVRLGYYGEYAAPGSHARFQIGAFEIGGSFDPTWGAGAAGRR